MIGKMEMKLPNYEVSINNYNGIINNKKVIISKEDINDIIRVIRTWKEKYKSNGLSDFHYYIYLYDNDNKSLGDYAFDGEYPEDFDILLSIIRNIYES